jgi:hypothetical protein
MTYFIPSLTYFKEKISPLSGAVLQIFQHKKQKKIEMKK